MSVRQWHAALCVVFLVLVSPVEGAEVKEDVIKEFASDLAEIGRVLASGDQQPSKSSMGSEYTVEGKWTMAESVPQDFFVAGKVGDLKPDARTSVAKSGVKGDSYIATWAAAFEPKAPVFASGFTPHGTAQTLEAKGLTEKTGPITWVPAQIATAVWGAVENKIAQGITMAQDLKKKYAGKGIIVKGFSVTVPIPSLSVNFELE